MRIFVPESEYGQLRAIGGFASVGQMIARVDLLPRISPHRLDNAKAQTPPREDALLAVDIVFETRSLTEDNERGVATGWLPGRLSQTGRTLAVELGIRRRNDRISAIFVSDLGRATETVAIAFSRLSIPIHKDTRLRECNYGKLNGCPVEVIAGKRSMYIDYPFPGGQSHQQVIEATRAFLVDIRVRWESARILVVAHSANKWAFDCLLNGTPLEDLVDTPFDWQQGWTYVVQ